jgi:ligand-binding sensor domain-containing protein
LLSLDSRGERGHIGGVIPRWLRALGRVGAATALLWPWAGLCGRGQPEAPPGFLIDSWQTEEGLPQNSVTSILQSQQGYLWMGTYNGLVRFDGVRFTVFDTANTPELPTSRVTSLREDHRGNLWIGQETGDLAVELRGRFERASAGPHWPGGSIVAMEEDARGHLWLLNADGVAYDRTEDRTVAVPQPGTAPAGFLALLKEANGALWAARQGRLEMLVPGASGREEGPPAAVFVLGACASPEGGLRVLAEGRTRKWAGGRWMEDWGPYPLAVDSVTAMTETRKGTAIVGTLQRGLFFLEKDGSSRQFSRENGLSANWARCVIEDQEGSIWAEQGAAG